MQEEQLLLMLKMINKKKEAKENKKKWKMVHNLNILPERGSIFYD